MIDFLKEYGPLVSRHWREFLVFAIVWGGAVGWFVSWVKSHQLDLLRERITAKDEQIDRLRNDAKNVEELPKLKEQIAAMRSELDDASNADYVGALELALSGDTSAPAGFVNSLLKTEVVTDLSVALAKANATRKPIFGMIFDPAHPSKSRIEYSAGYFLDYQTTRDLVDERFVVAVLESEDAAVRELVPNEDPLENVRWIVMDGEGKLFASEGLYANPDEGLKRTREVLARIDNGKTERMVSGTI